MITTTESVAFENRGVDGGKTKVFARRERRKGVPVQKDRRALHLYSRRQGGDASRLVVTNLGFVHCIYTWIALRWRARYGLCRGMSWTLYDPSPLNQNFVTDSIARHV
jgi:hypothetical protein